LILLTEIQYNPPVRFFQELLQAEALLWEQHEHYIKQSYRNRCHILTAHGPKALIIPVKKGNQKIRITDIEIDYDQKWLNTHWRTIRSAYGGAPYYEFYSDYLREIYDRKTKYLFEFNVELLKLYLKLLKISKPVLFTQSYETDHPARVLDLRNKIHPKIQPDILHVKPYNQVFGKQFVPDLSILDLLFSHGPESVTYLQASPTDG
jgi:hypothetical protein